MIALVFDLRSSSSHCRIGSLGICSMAMRSVVSRSGVGRLMDANRRLASASGFRYFSDDKGRILSEEERAKENVYIQKWEREKLEKQKKKAEKEKAEREKSEKKAEGETHES